ncbi:MAG: hypothetical protein U1D69_11340 [Polynucleobacter sp.]|nr:hypothetical protein [Polynucleobacter sp.]
MATVAVWFWFGGKFPSDAGDLLAAGGTTSAVLVGFVATAKAIILSVAGSPVFKQIKSAGYHTDLFLYLYEATLAGVLFLLICILGFFVLEPEMLMPIWYRAMWVGAGSWALYTFLRVLHVIFKLLEKA